MKIEREEAAMRRTKIGKVLSQSLAVGLRPVEMVGRARFACRVRRGPEPGLGAGTRGSFAWVRGESAVRRVREVVRKRCRVRRMQRVVVRDCGRNTLWWRERSSDWEGYLKPDITEPVVVL